MGQERVAQADRIYSYLMDRYKFATDDHRKITEQSIRDMINALWELRGRVEWLFEVVETGDPWDIVRELTGLTGSFSFHDSLSPFAGRVVSYAYSAQSLACLVEIKEA